MPWRNWKQWLCKILGEGGRGGNKVHYGLCESGEFMKEVFTKHTGQLTFSFFSLNLGKFPDRRIHHPRKRVLDEICCLDSSTLITG